MYIYIYKYITGLIGLACLSDFTVFSVFSGLVVLSGFAVFSGFTGFVFILWPS